MTLTSVLIFAVFALVLAGLSRTAWFSKIRTPLLLCASVLAIYWLQPALPIRGLDFWLPTLTLFIAVWGWVLTSPPEERAWRRNLPTLLLLLALVLVIALTRYLSASGVITPSRPPQVQQVLLFLAVSALIIFLISKIHVNSTRWLWIGIAELLLLFVILKLPPLTSQVSSWLRSLAGQSPQLASGLDIRWLGFSYIAFRLIHTLRDRQSGRLPLVSLQEYLVYLIFFPALAAGPIDRIERFLKDLRTPVPLTSPQLTEGGRRFVIGLFKKFVLADLSGVNGAQPHERRPGAVRWLDVGQCVCLRLADLLRLQRLHRYCPGDCALVGFHAAGELPRAVPQAQSHPVLEQLAHHPDAMVQVLFLQPDHARAAHGGPPAARDLGDLPHPALDDGLDRPLARDHLELYRLGSLARHWVVCQQPLERVAQKPCGRDGTLSRIAYSRHYAIHPGHLPLCRVGVGVVRTAFDPALT